MLPTSNSRRTLLEQRTSNYLLLEIQVKRKHGNWDATKFVPWCQDRKSIRCQWKWISALCLEIEINCYQSTLVWQAVRDRQRWSEDVFVTFCSSLPQLVTQALMAHERFPLGAWCCSVVTYKTDDQSGPIFTSDQFARQIFLLSSLKFRENRFQNCR